METITIAVTGPVSSGKSNVLQLKGNFEEGNMVIKYNGNYTR